MEYILSDPVIKTVSYCSNERNIEIGYKIADRRKEGEELYSINNVKGIAAYYFYMFEYETSLNHPVITPRVWAEIITKMRFIYDEDQNAIEIEPDDYDILIDDYFNTTLQSDRNISHFFSGEIRLFRYYNTLK